MCLAQLKSVRTNCAHVALLPLPDSLWRPQVASSRGCNPRPCTVQVLYNNSQTQTQEMQAKLDSQKRKRQQLEEEVSASQAHIAELTAILKSAVRSNSVSGPTGSQSPRSAALSREASGGEVGPRLRSKELQGEAHCMNCWTVSA